MMTEVIWDNMKRKDGLVWLGAYKKVFEVGSGGKMGNWQTEWVEETLGHRYSTECTRM